MISPDKVAFYGKQKEDENYNFRTYLKRRKNESKGKIMHSAGGIVVAFLLLMLLASADGRNKNSEVGKWFEIMDNLSLVIAAEFGY